MTPATALLRLWPLLALPLTLTACQDRQADTLRQRNAQLTAQVKQLQGQLAAAQAQASDAAQLKTLLAELDWRRAQGYSATVHAAFLGRLAEDPMYTPEGLVKEVPDCTRATAVGDRDFGPRPDSVRACRVEADGDNDVRVTVQSQGHTFVNGVEGSP